MWTINEVTGQLETQFQGKLMSEPGAILNNMKGTEYRLTSIELPKGKIVSARIYEKSYKHGVVVGQKYLCTATQYDDKNGVAQIDIIISHLTIP